LLLFLVDYDSLLRLSALTYNKFEVVDSFLYFGMVASNNEVIVLVALLCSEIISEDIFLRSPWIKDLRESTLTDARLFTMLSTLILLFLLLTRCLHSISEVICSIDMP